MAKRKAIRVAHLVLQVAALVSVGMLLTPLRGSTTGLAPTPEILSFSPGFMQEAEFHSRSAAEGNVEGIESERFARESSVGRNITPLLTDSKRSVRNAVSYTQDKVNFAEFSANGISTELLRGAAPTGTSTAAPCGFANAPKDPSPMDCYTNLVADDSSNDSTSVGTRTPVIFIHGLFGNRIGDSDDPQNDAANHTAYFANLIAYLKSADPQFKQQYKVYRFHYKSNIDSVWNIARSFRNRIDDLVMQNPQLVSKKIFIVAHSMGGLVARSYMEEHNTDYGATFQGLRGGARVSKLITLATPHHGSTLANDKARISWHPIWGIAFDAADYSVWEKEGGCKECNDDPSHVNRSDLRYDNFDGIWNNNSDYLNDPKEQNAWLRNLNKSARYNHLISVYSGYIGSDPFVDLAGKSPPRDLAVYAYDKSVPNLILSGVLIKRIELNDFKSDVFIVDNDGAVPPGSAKFNQASVARRVSCGGYDHEDMHNGGTGDCVVQGTSARKRLFSLILEEFPLAQPPIATRSLATNPSSSWSFGSITNGQFSTSNVTLLNGGSVGLTVNSITLNGPNANQFSLSGVPPGSFNIAPNATVSFTVRFSPTSVGAKSASLVISNNSDNAPSHSINLTGTGVQAGCSLSLSAAGQSIPSSGTSGSFTIQAAGCSAAVSTGFPWITVSVNGSMVNYSVARNSGGLRMGTIDVQANNIVRAFTVTQDGTIASCTSALSQSTQHFGANSGSGTFLVSAGSNCLWSAGTGSPWITVNTTGLRTGTQEVNFSVQSNTSQNLRFGTITIQGQNFSQVFTVSQDGSTNICTYSLSESEQDIPASGGNGVFTLTTGSGCPWQVSTPDRWITISSTSNGTGSRTITYTAGSNLSTTTRLGSISVQGSNSTQLLTVNQSGQPATYPNISLPATSFQIGEALLNTTAYQSVVINNTGQAYLSLGSIYRSDGSEDFDSLEYGQSPIIPPGGSTSVTIRLTPTSTGSRSATFAITSNDADQPTASFSVSGIGVTQITGGIDFVWTNKFTLPAGKQGAAVATLAGKIYVLGGSPFFKKCYKYDPTTNTWTQIPDAPLGQLDGGGAAISGKIYMVGGSESFNRIQIYDPVTDQWSLGATIPSTRQSFSVASANGKLYAFGGQLNNSFIAEVDEYNPSTDTWALKANMPTPRWGATATTVDNLIYVIGGYQATFPSNTVEVYNPTSNTWTTKVDMPSRRRNSASAVLNNKIYVIGGQEYISGSPSAIVEEYDPATNRWSARNPITFPRWFAVTAAVNNKIYVIGGWSPTNSDVLTVEEGALLASPKVNLPSTSAAFGDVPVGVLAEKTLEIQNLGNALLTLSYTRISGSQEFFLFRRPDQLGAGATAKIKIRIAPTSTGQKTAVFRINTNDPATPSLTFSVTANGIPFQPIANGSWQIVGSTSLSLGPFPRGIAIRDGNAYVSRSEVGLAVIDLATGSVSSNISFTQYPNGDPGHVAIAGNRAYVALSNLGDNGQLVVVNRDTNAVSAYIPIGADPWAVVATNDRVYVGIRGGAPSIKVLDALSNAIIGTIPLEGNGAYSVSSIAIEPLLGKMYVVTTCHSCDESGIVSIIDLATNSVIGTIAITNYRPNRISIAGNRAYVSTNASVEVVDLSSSAIVSSIMLPEYTDSIAATPEYVLAINSAVNKVIVISAATNSVVGEIDLFYPLAIETDPSTNRVYVGTGSDSAFKTLRLVIPGFSISTNAQSLAAVSGGQTTFTTTVTSIDGFNGGVGLSCEGLPTGSACQFGQNPVNVAANGSASTMLTVSVPSGTVAGPYGLRVVGTENVAQAVVSSSRIARNRAVATTGVTDFQNLSLTVPTCDFSLSGQSRSVGAAASTGSVDIAATTGCPWAAVSNDAWITITSGASGDASGTVDFSVAANTGTTPRFGTLTIAGFTFTINQAADCPAITINPTNIPDGKVGTAYNQPLIATGGLVPLGFTVSTGGLPSGLTLSPTGLLSGTPTASGTFNFTVRATDGNNCYGEVAYSLMVASIPAYEADVAPRPTGSGTVVVSDWVQVGRFSVGLDTPSTGSEFQRADCAPLMTQGDGQISVADWVQAGRYSVGLDPLSAAGGPSTLPTTVPSVLSGNLLMNIPGETQGRVVRAVDAEFKRGQIGVLQVEFDALGNENALAFTLNYDAGKAVFLDAVIDRDLATSARLLVNARLAADGRIAIAIALPTGRTFAAGTHNLLSLRFVPAGGEGVTTMRVAFDDSLIARELVTVDATRLPQPLYSMATITIDGSALAVVSAASFATGMVAPESIAAAFGTGLAVVNEVAATESLPIELGGTAVTVRDSAGGERKAPIFFVSPNQVNFQIPAESAFGPATVIVTGRNGTMTEGLITIAEVAPGLFTAGAMAAGNTFRAGPGGDGIYESLIGYEAATDTMVPIPIDAGGEGETVYLVLYGTGIRNRQSLDGVKVRIGGIDVAAEYAGPQGSVIGLDQINLRLPSELAGRGEVIIVVYVNGIPANRVKVHIK